MNELIQPIRSTVLHIRSKDATQLQDGFNTNFSVDLQDPIKTNIFEEIHIQMMSAEIPFSFYNISDNLNNTILKYDTNQTLIFTTQDYSIFELVDFCNADTNFSAIFTTSYDEQKNKINFLNKTGITHTIDLQLSTINKVIGFDETEIQRTVLAGATLTSDYVCNLATIHSIFIKSSMATGNVLSTRAGNSTTLQKISIDVNTGGIIYLNQSDFRQISVSQANIIDQITFSITDQNDNLLQTNNVNFELSFLFQVYLKQNTLMNNDNSNRRNLNNSIQRNFIPTQPTRILRQNQPLIVDELDIDSTHPIENTSDIQHATNRLVLDNLLDLVEQQN